MAFSTVNDLYTSIKDYMNRDEESLNRNIPYWVSNTEDELDKLMRHPAGLVAETYTVKKGLNRIPAPLEMTEIYSIRSLTTGEMLYRKPYEILYESYNTKNYPMYFASLGPDFYLDKSVDEDTNFEFVFYSSPPKLGTTDEQGNLVSSNFYLKVMSDFMLASALSKAFLFDGQPDKSASWAQNAQTILNNLNDQIKREEFQGSTTIAMCDIPRLQHYF